MGEFTGWKKLDNIKIVYSIKDSIEFNNRTIPKAFIVDSSNTKQLEKAIEWSRQYTTDINAKPVIIDADNCNFEFSLAMPATKSYQTGGKLSFWMCILKKEGVPECAVGVNTDILINTLLESTFVKGKCNEKVLFVRKAGQLGVITETMQEYKEMLKDTKIRKDVCKKKTKKWEVGYEYITLTQRDLLLGYFKKVMDVDKSKQTIRIDMNGESLPITCFSFSDISMEERLDRIIKFDIISYKGPNFAKSFPARQKGEKIFDEAKIYDIVANELLSYVKNIYCKSPADIPNVIAAAFTIYDKHPEITKEILNLVKKYIGEDTENLSKEIYPTRFSSVFSSREVDRNMDNLHELYLKTFKHYYCNPKFVTDRIEYTLINGDKTTEVSSYSEMIDYFIELVK